MFSLTKLPNLESHDHLPPDRSLSLSNMIRKTVNEHPIPRISDSFEIHALATTNTFGCFALISRMQ